MKNVAKKIVLSVSVWAVSAGASLWASQPEEESTAQRSLPSFLNKKDARYFTPDDIALANKKANQEINNEEAFDEPAPVLPSTPRPWQPLSLEGDNESPSINNGSSSTFGEKPEETKSPKTHRKSVKKTHSLKGSKESVERESPKAGRRKANPSVKNEDPFATHLPSSSTASSKIVLPIPVKVTFVEEDEKTGPVMKVKLPSHVAGAPPSLTYEEVKRLLGIPLEWRKLDLGYSMLAGDVVRQKEEIQGGLASHKLAAPGVQRIANILAEYPNAKAKLDIDEKRISHTLSAQGFEGFVGHYYLEDGSSERLASSEFTIAFAIKK
ncbi:hypothetical protein IM40_06095 [Candidatus Paracaedimonas acanthamoebae]|nr:hypothetical protein IM40_06095 [Candidatus Paracaedimonas acanthamoebae]